MSNLGQIDASLQSDKGRGPTHNEDFVLWREPTDPEDEAENGWIYSVADGVGGADAGEVASQFASERLHFHYLELADQPDAQERVKGAFFAANNDLRNLAKRMSAAQRMATTMVAAVIFNEDIVITNVGDSRGYLLRKNSLQQVTRDHSLVAKLLEEGVLTPQQAIDYPRPNVILYSLGSDHEPQIDQFPLKLESGDIVLLCSDGLTRHLSDDDIAELLIGSPASKAATELIQLANERGGKDNISVAVIRYWPGEKKRATAAAGSASAKAFLWVFTAILSILQSAGIFFVWLKLFT